MDTKKSIIDASIKMFAKYGFDKTSVDDIANAAGTAKGTLYYHFKSKDEILLELMERGIEDFSSTLRKKVETGRDPNEKIDIIIETQLDYFFRYRDFCRILLTEIWRFENKWKTHIKQIQDQYLKIIEQTINDGIKTGQFNPRLSEEAATVAVFSLVSLASLDWAIFHTKRPKKEMVETIKTILKKGLLSEQK